MKTKFTIFILIVFFSFTGKTQNWQWAKCAISASNNISEGNAVCADPFGNVITTGNYNTTLTIGTNTFTNGQGYYIKYDANGNLLWAKSDIGSGTAYDLSTDPNGNIYAVGVYGSTTIFGTYTLAGTGAPLKMFIVKFDPNGNILWAKNTNTGCNLAISVSNDAAGNAYVSGNIYDSISVFGTTTLTANTGSANPFLVKYDANGNVVWAKQGNNNGTCYARAVTTDAVGNSYWTGTFNGTISFGTFTLTNTGSNSIYVVKYDPSGNPVWAKKGTGNGTIVFAYGADLDNNNNLYLAGTYNNTSLALGTNTLTNPVGAYNMFLAKYDQNGNEIWARNSSSSYCFGCDVSVEQNDIFISGDMKDTLVLNTTTLVASPGYLSPGFVAHYDVNGNVISASSIASGGDDMLYVSVDKFCNAFVGADFTENFTIGTSTLTNLGGETPFVAKLSYTCEIDQVGLSKTNKEPLSVSVFPNPNNGTFTIKLNNDLPNAELVLINTIGQKIHQQKLNGGTSQIDLKELSTGLYTYLILNNNQQINCGKLVIE